MKDGALKKMRDTYLGTAATPIVGFDLAEAVRSIERTGIVPVAGAFTPDWSARLFHDLVRRADEARPTPGGTASRGPDRVYFSVPPETLSGFVEIISHPSLIELCDAVLGPGWQVVEVGCDLPGPDAQDQPGHRDYFGRWDCSTSPPPAACARRRMPQQRAASEQTSSSRPLSRRTAPHAHPSAAAPAAPA
jgi:hypothetical protein